MDAYEATKVVFSRIQSLDPENASKIMGILLIQDHGEKEMIRLAFGPENLLYSVVVKARHELGISRPDSTAGAGATSRFLPGSLKIPTSFSLSSLASPSSNSSPSSSTWGSSVFSELHNPENLTNSSSMSTTAAINGVSNSSRLNPWTPPFYKGGSGDLMDEIHLQLQEEQHEAVHESIAHRRSVSVSDINMGLSFFLDDPVSGLGWKPSPCLYYAKGFCKNGSSCKFVHDGSTNLVGSPSNLEIMEQCHELLRSKSMQQQKLLAAMASPGSPTFPYKGLGLLPQQQQSDSPRVAAALMMGEDLHKFSRSRLDSGRADSNPASRQIYLTFPADSTFREEDVSNYFSIYGPVQDVRIPYQQKRMFGFVTFVYPETVKIILAKGNPHFVCDARVLVKPYKEKGKVPDKFRKQQQQIERGEFSACNSPTSLDSRGPFDVQLGARMAYDTQYMLWKRKLEEQADLQQALELQSRRLMGLQLLDVKANHHHHRSLSTGAPIPSPIQSPNSIFNQTLLGSDPGSPDAPDEICASPPLNDAKQALQQAINEATDKDRENENSFREDTNNNNGKGKEGPCLEDNNLPESFEHYLPDSPFASPTKGASKYMSAFSGGSEMDNTSIPAGLFSNNNAKASAFALDIPAFKSCYLQIPRFSPGHGAIGM